MDPDPASLVWVHASAVVVGETGILVRGPAGAGKTTLVLALADEAARSGSFSRIVGDDTVGLRVLGRRVLARPHPRTAGLAEWRGLGILQVEHETACVIRMVVDFAPDADRRDAPRLPEPEDLRTVLMGVALPALRLRPDVPTYDSVRRVLRYCSMFRAGS